jgi:IMP dehydrogenase
MTRERLVTVRENCPWRSQNSFSISIASKSCSWWIRDYRCVGFITVKDIEKAQKYPNACKDERGRLRVAAATNAGVEGVARAITLLEAECDVIVVDTAHGHSQGVLDTVARIKRESNYAQVVAGNVATADGAKALIDASADAIKVGSGQARSTRIVAGVGVPRLRHHGCGVAARKRRSGHRRWWHQIFRRLAKAIAAGAGCARYSSFWPEPTKSRRGVSVPGRSYKAIARWVSGRHGARLSRSLFQAEVKDTLKLVPEASRVRCPIRVRPGRDARSSAACAPPWAIRAVPPSAISIKERNSSASPMPASTKATSTASW